MRIAVIGARAVGSVLGSLLWRSGEDVVLVGRTAHVAAIRAAGLSVEGVLGGFNATPHAEERLSTRPDLALLTVKTQDIVTALAENAAMLQGVPIVVLQNGLRGDELAATVVDPRQLVSGVVAVHAESLSPGHVVLTHSEGLLIGRPDGSNDALVERVRSALEKALPTSVTSNMRGARWTKLIVTLDVAERAGIRLEPIPGTSLPLERIEKPWSSKGPIWPSVGRGRPTEIEYLNGEVVRMGRKLQIPAPLNALAVTLVQRIASERRYLTVREIEDAAGSAAFDPNQ